MEVVHLQWHQLWLYRHEIDGYSIIFSARFTDIFGRFWPFFRSAFFSRPSNSNDSWTTNKREVCDASKNGQFSFIVTTTAKPHMKIQMKTMHEIIKLINTFIAFCDNDIKRNIFLANYIRIFRFCRFLTIHSILSSKKKRIIKN